MSDRPWKHRRRAGVVAALVGGALALAGCGGAAGPGAAVGTATATSAAGGGLRFAVVTHGTAGDAFWSVVKNGAQAAGQKLGVAIDYRSDGDPSAQAKLIDNEVAQHVDGLVVSMANPDALQTSIHNAVQAGIPVITINSGEDRSAEFGALTHVGQNEGIAGEQAGTRFKQAGRTKLLCVIHEAGNIGLNQRCDGARRTFGDVTTVQVDVNNPTDAQGRIRGALQADPAIDAVLALNSQIAAGAVAAVAAAGSKAQVATFDLNSDVVNEIKAGQIVFAVDQQPYLQGYLPIVFLQLYKENADTVGGGRPVLTGPAFVDKSNVDAVASYVAHGTR
jgi:simple sugar transport system substrate-binding protein